MTSAKSKREKGLAFQRWIKQWLEKQGWVVHNQVPVGRLVCVAGKTEGKKQIYISKRNDVFGCIDLIAKKPNKPTLWIQATLHTGKTEKKKSLDAIPWNTHDFVLLFMKRPSSEVDIFYLFGNELHPLGKIIRGKWFKLENINWEF